MVGKNIKKALHAKIDNWIDTIDDKDLVKSIKQNAIVTGGAIVSMLNSEKPNDYDIYFKTKESCKAIAEYYAKKWNEVHKDKLKVNIEEDEEGRITAMIKSLGVVAEEGESTIDDNTEPGVQEVKDESAEEKPRYRPRYISTNALSLSQGIQIIIRFYGSVEEIHTNYDFVHCTCAYDYAENSLSLPSRALEAIINKELYYDGSKYPLCSIIRTRKFISRGWKINAGQYVKMALQLNELDLTDLSVFKDQLIGVDSAYFNRAIEIIMERKNKEPEFKVDNTYLIEIINRIF